MLVLSHNNCRCSPQDHYFVNMLIGGYDDTAGPELFFLDYFGAMVQLPFAVHGYGSYFSLSIMDRYYKEGEFVH